MPNDEYLSISYAYASLVLSMWREIIIAAENFRVAYIGNVVNNDAREVYIAKLVGLWGELRPKVENRPEMQDVSERFMTFQRFFNDPRLLTMSENADSLFGLERVIRDALEKLRITQFDEGQPVR